MAVTQGVGSTSSDIYQQIMANQANLDPYMSNAGLAPQYFQDNVAKLFNYNMPAIQNAAGLEARAYSLPGELMGQYDQEYGGNLGGMAAINSILKNIGTQFGVSNAAWNMVDQAKMRQEELARQMNERFGLEKGALKSRHGMLLPLWQQMYGEEQANERLNRQLAARTGPTQPIPTDLPGVDRVDDPEKPGDPWTPTARTPRPGIMDQINQVAGWGARTAGNLGFPTVANWLNDFTVRNDPRNRVGGGSSW